MKVGKVLLLTLLAVGAGGPTLSAAPVFWTDWTSGTAGPSGSAVGTLSIGLSTVNVSYAGEIEFLITGAGTNYWSPSAPYISGLVDNAPPASDIIALSGTTAKTLTFSQAIDNLFFGLVSLNGNGYVFNQDFEIVSTGAGFWGDGTLTKTALGGGQFRLDGSGEPHGVIRFTGSVSSITWTSAAAENWNGFTVGTYGLADTGGGEVPEPGTMALAAAGLIAGAIARRRMTA